MTATRKLKCSAYVNSVLLWKKDLLVRLQVNPGVNRTSGFFSRDETIHSLLKG